MDQKEYDLKEQDIFEYYHLRILRGLFDEKDVFSFLVLLRPFAALGSPIREFADFMVHRKRDRGRFCNFLNTSRAIIVGLKESGPPATADEVLDSIRGEHPLFDVNQIAESLNPVLSKLGLETFNKERVEDIMLCILSLLQDARLLDKGGQELGRFLLIFYEEHLNLCAKIFCADGRPIMRPVLRVPNRYIRFKRLESGHFASTPNRYVTVVNINGRLRLHSE